VTNEEKGQNGEIGIKVIKGTNVAEVTVEEKKGTGLSKDPAP
jgi:hypothetical protein